MSIILLIPMMCGIDMSVIVTSAIVMCGIMMIVTKTL
jgi:hypothetical protein